MGTCGSHPPKYTLENLKELGINQKKEAATGCCPNIGGAQSGGGQDRCMGKGFSWPNNGEFAWGGLGGSCKMCSSTGSYGCSSKCGSGGGTIGGKRPTVKRIAYNANPVDCCSKSTPTNPIVNGKTCDPKYRGMSQSACQDILQSECTADASFSEHCLAWGNTSDNAQRSLDNYKAQYCNVPDNYRNDINCQTWCNTNTGKGRCDVAVSDYCADIANLNDDTCSCINSPIDQPQCTAATADGVDVSDKLCQVHGYLTANMKSVIDNAACPTVYNCKQDWGQSGDHNISRNIYQQMVCGSEHYESQNPITQTTTIPGTSIKLPSIPGMRKQDYIQGFPNTLIFIFIIVVVLVLTYKPNNISDIKYQKTGQKEYYQYTIMH